MLIIFDLDDTLIETTRDVTPRKLSLVIDYLIEKRVFASGTRDRYLQELLSIDQTQISAAESLKTFFEIHEKGKEFFEKSCEIVYGSFPVDWSIETVPGVKSVLKSLSSDSDLVACVSRGVYEAQLNKMKKAGIDISFFYKIIVSDQNKQLHYQNIVDEVKIDPKEVVVCGDRVKRDLEGAKNLGLWTILMLRGRGLLEDREKADFVARDLHEVENIISQLREEKG